MAERSVPQEDEMNGPKIAAIGVTVVMVLTWGYITWTARQAANAFGSGGDRDSARVVRFERFVQDVEKEMNGGTR